MTATASESPGKETYSTMFDELISHLKAAIDLAEQLRNRALETGDPVLIQRSDEMVQRTQNAARDYNENIADRPVDESSQQHARRIEMETNQNEAELAQLVRQLEVKVNATNKSLGIDVDNDGNVKFVDGGVARSAVENHKVLNGDGDNPGLVTRVDRLEQQLEMDGYGNSQRLVRYDSQSSDFSYGTFALVALVTIVFFWFLGATGLFGFGWTLGIAIGAVLGAVIGFAVAGRKSNRRQEVSNDRQTTDRS